VLLVSGLLVSDLIVSALGSTAAGRSIYFGASAAGGASTILDPSVAFAGAVTVEVSPPSERLRSPACAAAETRANPAIRMNLRMLKSPLEVDEYVRRTNIYVRQVTPQATGDGERRTVRGS
jgi:hypothetical protein